MSSAGPLGVLGGIGIGLVWPHGLEHSTAAWVLWVSGAPPRDERAPVLQPGPDCSNWQGQESPPKGAALLQIKQRDVQGAVRAAAPSRKEQMKVIWTCTAWFIVLITHSL